MWMQRHAQHPEPAAFRAARPEPQPGTTGSTFCRQKALQTGTTCPPPADTAGLQAFFSVHHINSPGAVAHNLGQGQVA